MENPAKKTENDMKNNTSGAKAQRPDKTPTFQVFIKDKVTGRLMAKCLDPDDYFKNYEPHFLAADEALRKADNDNPPKSKSRFKLLTRADLDAIKPPTYLIDDLIAEGSDNVVYGEDGSAKSFVCLDWALSMATGTPWFGHSTTKGDVVYIYTEGRTGLPARVSAWEEHHGRKAERIFLQTEPVHVSKLDQVEAFIAAIKEAGIKPRLIVIDTLARNKGPGLDINKDADMDGYHEGTRAMRKAFPGCATITVHHSGKDSSRGSKGATSIEDPMDGVFKVVKPKSAKQGTLTIEKQRDGDAGEQIHFRLTAEIGNTGSITIEPDAGKGIPDTWEDVPETRTRKRAVAPSDSAVLAALEKHPDGLSYTELLKITKQKKRTFDDALKRLKVQMKIELGAGGKYVRV